MDGYGGYGDGGDGYGNYDGYGDGGGNAGYGEYGNSYGDSNNEGGAGGGGFFNSSNASSPTRSNQTKLDLQTPITVRQAYEAEEAPDSSFTLNGRAVSRVKLIGKVQGMEKKTTNMTTTIEDGTGSIAVQKWSDEKSANPHPDIEIGSYVKVYGALRNFNGKRMILGYQLVPMPDHNEITRHALECVYTFLYVTQGSLNPKVRGNSGIGISAGGSNAPAFNHPTGAGQMLDSSDTAGNEFESLIMGVFDDPTVEDLEDGLSIEDAHRKLGGRHGLEEVRKSVMALVERGNLYSTIDDEHYKSTGVYQ